tara:strand:- start:553 stop:1293 length:741 start_codon:yes stop_codon:yes gene_type:complete
MDRKTYMKDIYSRYWSYAREKEYGFLEYDKNLCNYIIKNVSKGGNVLDVGIGTGFPFGDFLQKGGYDVHGIDIAPILIEKCKKLNNKINCKVGDAENLTYPNNFFDCTYSFHSTFYFPNLCKVISEMIRVTNPNGLIIFDIQNKNNNECNKNYNRMILDKSNVFRKLYRYVKNIAKIILRKGIPDWTNIVHEVPTSPEIIYKHLKDSNIKSYSVMIKSNIDSSLKIMDKIGPFQDYPRLIFVFRKN